MAVLSATSTPVSPSPKTTPTTPQDRQHLPPVGLHIIADLYGVPAERIAYVEDVVPILERIVREAKLARLGANYHQFEPHGMTGVILLAESHLAIHTWPETGLVNLDIFTCGDPEQAREAFRLALKYFQPASYRHLVMERG
ncbi:MAG: S-adenosylmethionine decarboxylase [Chloroflexi bacterium]|nr:S-adenosylmethionine decarboxylase [Chloroflexota bacterium]